MDLSIESEELSSLMDGGRSGDISRTTSAQKTTVPGVGVVTTPNSAASKLTAAVPKPKVKKYKTRDDDYWDQHRYEDSQGSYFTGSSSYYFTDGEDDEDVDNSNVKRPSLPPPKITTSPAATTASKKTTTPAPPQKSASPAPKKPVAAPPPKQESEKSLSFTKTESDMHFSESSDDEPLAATKQPAPSPPAPKPVPKATVAVESSELAFTEDDDEDDDLVFTQDATPPQKPASPPHKMDETSELVFTEDSVSPSQDRAPPPRRVSASLNFTEDTATSVSKSGLLKPPPAIFNPRPSLPEDDLHFTAASTTNGDELAFSTVSDSTPAATPKNTSINPSAPPQTATEKLAAMEAANRARTANLLNNNNEDDDKTLNFTADSTSASNSRRPSTSPGSALNFSVTSTYTSIATGESDEDEASTSRRKFGSASPTVLKISQMVDQESEAREHITVSETQAHEASLLTLESYKTLCVVEVSESAQRSEHRDVEKSEWNSIMSEILPIALDCTIQSEIDIRSDILEISESSARNEIEQMSATAALMVSTIATEKNERSSVIHDEDTSRTHIQNDCTRQLELQLEEEAARAAAESWEELLAGTATREDEQRKHYEVDESSQFEQVAIEAITSEEAVLRSILVHSVDLESELIEIEVEFIRHACSLEAEDLEQRRDISLQATQHLESTRNLEVVNLEQHEGDIRSTISTSCDDELTSLTDQQKIEGKHLQQRLALTDTTLQHTHNIQCYEDLEFTELLGSHTCVHTEISKFTKILREEALGKYILEHNDASTRALYGLMEREKVIRSETVQRQSNEFSFQSTIKAYLLLQSSNVCEYRVRESLTVLEATEWASLLQLHRVELNHYKEVEAERQDVLQMADEAYKALVEAEIAGRFGTYLTSINKEESIARDAFEHDELQSSVRITALSEKQLDFHIRNLVVRQSTIKSETERRTLKEEEQIEIRDALHKLMVDGVIDLEQDILYASELAIREQSSRADMMNRAKLINEVRNIAFKERLTALEQEEIVSRRRVVECEELVRSSKVFIFDQQNVYMSAVTLFYQAKEWNSQLFQEWSIMWMEGYSQLLLQSSMEILQRASNRHRHTQHQLIRLSKELSSIEFSELMGRKMIQNELDDWWLGDGDLTKSVHEIAMFERQLISEILEDEQVSRWKIIASERREWWGQQAPIPDSHDDDAAFTRIPTSANLPPVAAHPINNKPSRPLSSSGALNIPRSNLSLRRYYTKLNQWAHEEVSARENFYSALSKSQSTTFVPASILPHRPHSARTPPTTTSAASARIHQEEDNLATSLPVIQSSWTGHIPKKPTSLQPRLRAAAVQNDEEATRENLLTSQQDEMYSMAYRLAAAKENDSRNRPLTWTDIDQLCKR